MKPISQKDLLGDIDAFTPAQRAARKSYIEHFPSPQSDWLNEADPVNRMATLMYNTLVESSGTDPDQDAALHACGRHLAQHGEIRRARAQAPGARQLGAEHTTGGAQSDAVMVSGRLGDWPRPEVTQRETPTPPRGAAARAVY